MRIPAYRQQTTEALRGSFWPVVSCSRVLSGVFGILHCFASVSSEVTANRSISGLPYSYGVFQKYYSDHEPFSSQTGIAAIGTSGLVSIIPYDLWLIEALIKL